MVGAPAKLGFPQRPGNATPRTSITNPGAFDLQRMHSCHLKGPQAVVGACVLVSARQQAANLPAAPHDRCHSLRHSTEGTHPAHLLAKQPKSDLHQLQSITKDSVPGLKFGIRF